MEERYESQNELRQTLVPEAVVPAQVISVAGIWGCVLMSAGWLGMVLLALLVKLLWG